MVQQYLFRAILYLLDGVFWTCSTMWVVTGFYGCAAKPSKNRRVLFVSTVLAYDILNLLVFYISQKLNKPAGVINGVLIIFLLIYWYRNIIGMGRAKKIVTLLIAVEFVVSIMNLLSCLFTMFDFEQYGGIVYNLLLVYMYIIIYTLFFAFLSWLSSRKRKEPMRFSLVLATLIMCMLLDMVLDFFNVEGYSELQPIIQLRIAFPEEILDEAMSVGILLIIVVIVLLFLIMMIRESEADYFYKKNTINEYYLEAQKNHYESLMESNREIRRMKHDMKNHIYCLQSLYQKEDYAELGEYLSGLGEHLEQADSSVHVGNEIADAILSEKKEKAEQKGIRFHIEGDMYGIHMSALDICTILSNMVDNAIEAVERLADEKKKIDIIIRKNNNYLLISAKNPTKELLVIRDNSLPTTKKYRETHGFGILNIKEAVARYDGEVKLISEELESEGYSYTMEVIIPY